MKTKVFDAAEMRRVHELDPNTKTVVLRQCWVVVFVNWDASSDLDVVCCATKELAEQVLSLFVAAKDEGKTAFFVSNGTTAYDLPCYSVDGNDFDTYYMVVEGWQPDDRIIRSLAELTLLCNGEIPAEAMPADEPEGVFLGEREDTIPDMMQP